MKKNLEKLEEDKYMTITVFAVFEKGKYVHSGLHQDILKKWRKNHLLRKFKKKF